MTNASACFLLNVKTGKKIPLPHDTQVFIGRNRNCEINDKLISRKQLILRADYEKKTVSVVACGANASTCNGCLLAPHKEYVLEDGDVLELVIEMHRFEVCFELKQKEERKQDQQLSSDEEPKDHPVYNPTSIYGVWETIKGGKLMIFSPFGLRHRDRVATFDLDETIITPRSGSLFPTHFSDWKIRFGTVPDRLRELFLDGFKLVIFTNQLNIGCNVYKSQTFKYKIDCILKVLKVPIQVYVATGVGCYNKPHIGMWTALLHRNAALPVLREYSFYVGAAMDRVPCVKDKKNKYQIRTLTSDELFAQKIGIQYYHPKTFFIDMIEVPLPPLIELSTVSFPYHQEVILMVGGHSTGKSTYCKKHIVPQGYVHISGDKLITWKNCAKKLEQALREKNSVVVDCANRTVKDRKRYIDLARKYNVPCRCFLMGTTLKHSMHNRKFRGLADKKYVPLTKSEIVSNWNKFQKPTVEEGFDEVVTVNLKSEFEREKRKAMFGRPR